MKYVLLLQAVQERKKFEFVEIVCNLVMVYNRIYFSFLTLPSQSYCHIFGRLWCELGYQLLCEIHIHRNMHKCF